MDYYSNEMNRGKDNQKRIVDLLIHNAIIVTINSRKEIIEGGSIAIDNGKLLEICETKKIQELFSGKKVVDASGKIVMPGLINLHYHSEIFSRGLGKDLGLEAWLFKIYYPMMKGMSNEDTHISGLLGYTELIKSGTTCVNDMYINLIALAEAAEKTGIRAVLAGGCSDYYTGLITLEENENALRQKNNSAEGRITFRFGFETIMVASLDYIKKCRRLADKYGVGIHIHINESREEADYCIKKYGKTSVELLQDLNVLGTDVVAGHCVWLTEREVGIIKDTMTNVSYNPISNAKLGNGIAPVVTYLKSGINVGLGTDAAPWNNNNDMFEVMKYASLFQKAVHRDVRLLPEDTMLEMATINGAKALGLEDKIGSLEKGKYADLILIETNNPTMTPLLLGKNSNVLANLVFAAHGDCVDTVIINGRIVMENRKMLTVDENEVIKNATITANKIVKCIK